MAKILVIDDSKLVAHMAKSILSKQHHQVLLAEDGQAGIEIALAELPDLILLDLIMPGLNGYQVCSRIKEEAKTSDIPIIMLTSKADPADKVKGLEMGAADYVTKPFDEGELIARVKTHLKIKQLYEALQKKNRQLQEQANRDGLTGLYNHRFFKETVYNDFQKATRYNEPLACIIFDIDFFKKINDSYGHQAGDMVLKGLGDLVMKLMRVSDLSARYGGEEFALLLYHTTIPDAVVIGERLRKTVEQHQFRQGDLAIQVTISVGVSGIPHPDIQSANTLIDLADMALYKAKNDGRNRVISN
ncbi:diguanylate cyclase [Thermodesulfobacteriota bacterium]